MTNHHIVWTFEHDCVHGSLECSAPPDAQCRWDADCDCESWWGMDVDERGPFHLCMEIDDDTYVERDVKHRMRFGGECNVANFLNDFDDSGLLEGAEKFTRFEIGRTPVRTEWQGDHYLWKPVLLKLVSSS